VGFASLTACPFASLGQERTGREEILNFVSYNLFAFPYAWEAQRDLGSSAMFFVP